VVERLFDAVEQQMKANAFSITHSSKGRKRQKTYITEQEKWSKRSKSGRRRSKYFDLIDKIISKKKRTDSDNPNDATPIEKRYRMSIL
jgi:hypothetical protein